MKSNENLSIYNIFERLGHHETTNFPIKNHQKSCLQFKHTFWRSKWQKISKSDPKWCPKGHPKSIKNHPKSILGPSRVPLNASVSHLITKMVPKWSQGPPKWAKMVIHGPWKDIKITNILWQILPPKNYILSSAPSISILEILEILLILSLCKSAVNWLPEGPAAGAKP